MRIPVVMIDPAESSGYEKHLPNFVAFSLAISGSTTRMLLAHVFEQADPVIGDHRAISFDRCSRVDRSTRSMLRFGSIKLKKSEPDDRCSLDDRTRQADFESRAVQHFRDDDGVKNLRQNCCNPTRSFSASISFNQAEAAGCRSAGSADG